MSDKKPPSPSRKSKSPSKKLSSSSSSTSPFKKKAGRKSGSGSGSGSDYAPGSELPPRSPLSSKTSGTPLSPVSTIPSPSTRSASIDDNSEVFDLAKAIPPKEGEEGGAKRKQTKANIKQTPAEFITQQSCPLLQQPGTSSNTTSKLGAHVRRELQEYSSRRHTSQRSDTTNMSCSSLDDDASSSSVERLRAEIMEMIKHIVYTLFHKRYGPPVLCKNPFCCAAEIPAGEPTPSYRQISRFTLALNERRIELLTQDQRIIDIMTEESISTLTFYNLNESRFDKLVKFAKKMLQIEDVGQLLEIRNSINEMQEEIVPPCKRYEFGTPNPPDKPEKK